MIRNLTPHEIPVLKEDPNGELFGYVGYGSQKAGKRFRLVYTFPAESVVARSTERVTKVGELNGIPLVTTIYGVPENLPEYMGCDWIIVSLITAQAAKANGRTTSDLVMVGETVRNDEGRIIGCISFRVLE